MARLNTHLSATPQLQPQREGTVDSLYRDPTPKRTMPARDSTYSVISAASQNSDKENATPDSRENTPVRPGPSKTRHAMASRFLTPGSSTTASSTHPNKRRRTGEHTRIPSSDIFEDDNADVQSDQDSVEETHARESTYHPMDTDDHFEERFTRYYDPAQDPKLRQEIRTSMRSHHRRMEDNRDDFIKPGNDGIVKYVRVQNQYMTKVKQTSDAAIDSRVIVTATDLASKQLQNTLHGNSGVGIDVDQFVSRCIHFMRNGGEPQGRRRSTQQRRWTQATQPGSDSDDDDDDEESGEALDWALLGREACFQFTRRPPLPHFLLGPLSVQKKARKTQTQRTARSQRAPQGPATRPQELTQADIKSSDNSNLIHLVQTIRKTLMTHIESAAEGLDAELNELDDEPDDEDIEAAQRRHRIWQSSEGEAAVGLFDFVVNPRSFGQTVENLFYVSFLIKDAFVGIEMDGRGLPLIVPKEELSITEKQRRNLQKSQAIIDLDYETWKILIKAYDITEPLIPHREEEQTAVTAGGWYG